MNFTVVINLAESLERISNKVVQNKNHLDILDSLRCPKEAFYLYSRYSRSHSIELSVTGFRTLDGDTGEFNGMTSTVLVVYSYYLLPFNSYFSMHGLSFYG